MEARWGVKTGWVQDKMHKSVTSKFKKRNIKISARKPEVKVKSEDGASEDDDEPLLSSELITLFAPTNAAFSVLTAEQEATLLGSGIILNSHLFF